MRIQLGSYGFLQAFKLSSYLLLTVGFLSLFASDAIGPLWTLLYIAAVACGWNLRPVVLPDWLQAVIFVLFLAGFALDSLMFSDFVTATLHVLILVSLVKAFTLETERDYLVLYFISFAFLLFASAYTISILFLAALIVYLFAAILTFILFESKKAYEENRAARFSLKAFAKVAALITALIVMISVPIFLVIPRASLGLFRMDRQVDLNMSGFSDKVSLGDMGEIIVNTNVVMRVRVDVPQGSLPADLKWRGVALDHYDGLSWSNTRVGLRRLQRSSTYDGVQLSEKRRSDENLIQQSVVLEPFSNAVFGAPQMVLLTGDVVPRSFVFDDGNDAIGIYRRVEGPLKYIVYSDVSSRDERLSIPVGGEIPGEIRSKYLQLPELNGRIRQIAEEITRGSESSLERALAIERFLNNNFAYSLANKSAEAQDPLFDFLAVTKAGHCEYFATAQAILMRVVGVPTRVVNGFRVGEFNDFSGYFVVRQSDAHSWVEGYFPGPGWVEFDSTPAVAASRSRSAVARWLSQVLDAIDMFWTEVITFDRVKQIGFFRSVRYNFRDVWERLRRLSLKVDAWSSLDWAEQLKVWDLNHLIYLLLAGVLAGALWLLNRQKFYLRLLWRQFFLKKPAGRIAPDYYLEMLEILARKGLEKGPAETPTEFLQRVQPRFQSASPTLITELYHRNRFGNLPLMRSDLSDVHGWLKALKREWWQRGAPS